jgi:hypothetical protein
MPSTPKMKDTYVAIHGHFDQPPRENLWLGIIETEENTYPFKTGMSGLPYWIIRMGPGVEGRIEKAGDLSAFAEWPFFKTRDLVQD